MIEIKNNGAGLYTQPIVKLLKNLSSLTEIDLKNICDSDFEVSQSGASFYRCLKELRYLGFVSRVSNKYKLTSFGNELAMKEENDFDNYYLLGYIRCPECGKKGNLVRCKIESIKEFKRGMGVSVRCPICSYNKAPLFRNISKEEFEGLYNSI